MIHTQIPIENKHKKILSNKKNNLFAVRTVVSLGVTLNGFHKDLVRSEQDGIVFIGTSCTNCLLHIFVFAHVYNEAARSKCNLMDDQLTAILVIEVTNMAWNLLLAGCAWQQLLKLEAQQLQIQQGV